MKEFEQLRIVFFGTPDFAVASLDALVRAGAQVVAVVTAPDKPAGRGMQMLESAVKKYANAHGLRVLQPERMKSPEFLEELKSLQADLQVVVAFRMMPEPIWNMPPMGTINVHGSLLPQYRGAAPINRAIMNGETETGVTTFRLKHEIDTGNILLQRRVAILPEDNAGTLYDKLMHSGAVLLVETLRGLAAETLKEIPQDEVPVNELKVAPKIFKQDTLIDWSRPAEQVLNQVRGLSPYPAAYTLMAGKPLKIFSGHVVKELPDVPPGTFQVVSAGQGKEPGGLRFAAADGWLYIDEVQAEGKKRMDVASFLRGFRG